MNDLLVPKDVKRIVEDQLVDFDVVIPSVPAGMTGFSLALAQPALRVGRLAGMDFAL